MDDVVVLEWTFSPPNYFEEPLRIDRGDYVMIIDSGKAEARIQPAIYDKDPAMRDELHAALNDRFLGAQLLTGLPYELSKPSMYRLHPDGRRETMIFVDSGALKISGGSPDVVIKDSAGNVVSHTRANRIEKKRAMGELAAKFRAQDKTAASVLDSYNASIRDPNNEFVHLYEIVDALSVRFGGQPSALSALKVSRPAWSELGKLANNEPVRQGRHRGRKAGHLRDATEAELKRARSFARELIQSYLSYLDR
jgi:hypothetical protein